MSLILCHSESERRHTDLLHLFLEIRRYKVRSYGDLFREGDTIGVVLNMDLGTLRFARNGRDLGVAVQGLEGTLYPAFSMYNRYGRTLA